MSRNPKIRTTECELRDLTLHLSSHYEIHTTVYPQEVLFMIASLRDKYLRIGVV